MSSQQVVAPIVRRLTVEAPIERAFRVFSEKMGTWWPREHHIGQSALKDCVVEPKVGGRWYEVSEDGSECDWGKVLAYDPPRRLMLAWQLNTQFAYDPNLITEVEVTFQAEGPRRTHVELVHRNLERFGEGALPTREAMDGGWGGIMESFAQVAARE